MTRDDSPHQNLIPNDAPAAKEETVKREFLRCISIERDLREEALQTLDRESPSIAVQVRRLIGTLESGVWAERLSQFNPALAKEVSTRDIGGTSDPTSHPVDHSIWGQTLSSNPDVLLNSDSESPVTVSRSARSEIASSRLANRYRLDGEIARGGMGAVIKGRDTALGRDLAVKVLLREHESRPDTVQRFIEEAQIGGQLQHPGIAPVYDVGQLDDERPFFTMKLIKGKTLSALLAERKSPEDDQVKMLGIFEQICQTMAYAHSRNVVHRDLKPSNVMVGAFGEVQVMDWGLAKVMKTGGVADERRNVNDEAAKSVIQTVRSADPGSTQVDFETDAGSHTRMGSVLGTPAYMSPEQATGDLDRLDHRSDVFSLGSILCEILTGRPVYRKDAKAGVLTQARLGETQNALKRLRQSSADAELIALAVECLEIDPARRPRDAQTLSQRVADHFASTDRRLRESELEVARSKTKAEEERKRRRVVLALAVGVVFAVIVAAIGWTTIERAQTRLAKIQADAEIADAADRSRFQQRVESELATAEALTQSPGGMASEIDLMQAMEAIERAKSLATERDLDAVLTDRIETLLKSVSTQQKDARLLNRLTEIWEIDRQYMASKNVAMAPRNDNGELGAGLETTGSEPSPDRPATEDHFAAAESAEDIPQTNPAELYERAFANWGVTLSGSSLREISDRILTLPKEQKTIVTVSLDRWRDLLIEPKSIADWQRESWTVLQPVDFPNAAPTRFEVLPGDSILARGPVKEGAYQFELQTDRRRVSGLRLELLLHDSLPNNGPGRNDNGMFSMRGLKIVARPKSNPQKTLPLDLVEGVADYADLTYPFQIDHWHGWGGGGSQHVAFYRLSTPIEDPEGFLFTISTESGSWKWQKRARLGHFRWSSASLADRRSDRDFLGSLLGRVDQDSWREQFRSARDSGDVKKLVTLARDVQAATHQPSILIGLLTDRLMGLTGQELERLYLNRVQWNAVTPTKVLAENGTVYKIRDDNHIDATGPSPKSEIAEVHLPLDDATKENLWIRIDFKARYPDAKPYISRDNLLYIRELEVVPANLPSHQNLIASVFADYSFEVPIEQVVDGEFDQWYSMPTPDRPHSIYLRLLPIELNSVDSLVLRLHVGDLKQIDSNNLPDRFQISYATTPSAEVHPIEVAGSLLTDVWAKRPSDATVHLQLSKYFRRKAPCRRKDSLTHAIAACSLDPNSMAAGLNLLDLVEGRDLVHNVPLRNLVAKHYKFAGERLPANVSCHYFSVGLKSFAIDRFNNDRIEEFRESTKSMLSIFMRPAWSLSSILDYFLRSKGKYERVHDLLIECSREYFQGRDELAMADVHLQFGHRFTTREHFEEAAASYRKAVRIAPDRLDCRLHLGRCLNKLGDSEGALEQEKKVLRLNPEDATAHNNLGVSLFKLRRYSEAVESYQKAVSLKPEDAIFHANLAYGLLKTGDFDKTRQAFDSAIANRPDRIVAAFDVGASLVRDVPIVDVLRTMALEKQGAAATGGDASLTEDRDTNDPQRDFRVKEAIRRFEVVAAEVPSHLVCRRELGLAFFRDRQWDKAAETLDSVKAEYDASNTIEHRNYLIPLALAHKMLGNAAKSRVSLADGFAWIKVFNKWDNDSLQFMEAAISAFDLSVSDQKELLDYGFQSLVEEISDLIQSEPSDPFLHRSLGLVYFEWKKFEQAIPHLSRANDLDSANTHALAVRAECYLYLGRYQSAFKDRDELVMRQPRRNNRYFERAIVQMNLGRFSQAIDDIEQGLQIDPKGDAPWFPRARARALAGEIYLDHLDQPKKALEQYNLAIELEPDNQDYIDGKHAAQRAISKLRDGSSNDTY